MTPEGKRKFNTVAGSTFVLLGLVAWGMTVYFGFVPAPPKPHPVSLAPSVDLASCRSLLQRMGYQASVRKGEVVATREALDDPQAQLEQATLAIGACKLPLTEFCMGTACENAPLTFALGTASAATTAPAPSAKAPTTSAPATKSQPNVPSRPPARAAASRTK